MTTKGTQLVERLKEAGTTGLDLSPGNPLCAEAADALERLKAGEKAADKLAIEAWDRTAEIEEKLAEARAREGRKDDLLQEWLDTCFQERDERYGSGISVVLSPAAITLGQRTREALAAPAPEQEAEQEKCSFPDCGCAEARLCMFPPANEGAMAWNLPKRR